MCHVQMHLNLNPYGMLKKFVANVWAYDYSPILTFALTNKSIIQERIPFMLNLIYTLFLTVQI